jgi:peptidoglycan/LPS O-acetylase OafA/YrhL
MGRDDDGSGRNGWLDLARVGGALFVAVYHFGQHPDFRLGRIWPALDAGWAATDVFLMVSGFVLAAGYSGRLAAGRITRSAFFVRRLLRVWPAHLAVLAAYLLVWLLVERRHHDPLWSLGRLPEQALLVQAWRASPPSLAWNGPTWTLSALLVCYALAPWLFMLTARRRGAWAVLAGVAALAALGTAWGVQLWRAPGLERALPLFAAGAALHRLLPLGSPRPRPRPALALAARCSFALYLTHSLVAWAWIWAMARAGYPHWPRAAQWACWSGMVPASLVVAYGFDRWVDAPVQRALRRWRTGAAPAVGGDPRRGARRLLEAWRPPSPLPEPSAWPSSSPPR